MVENQKCNNYRADLFRSSAYILGIGLVLWLAIFYVIGDRFAHEDEVVVPYEKISEFRQDIADLPVIGIHSIKVSDDDWHKYELVAKRMRISNSELIKSGFHGMTDYQRAEESYDMRSMLLLRVCFKCPNDRSLPANIPEGWVSSSAMEAGKIIGSDINWPVGYRFGHFYLKDTINGYEGRPYDAALEYDWMLTNAEWR